MNKFQDAELLRASPLLRRVFCKLWCSEAERTQLETSFQGGRSVTCSCCGAVRVARSKMEAFVTREDLQGLGEIGPRDGRCGG